MSDTDTSMRARLQGKTIVITGASSGIGRSTVYEFSRTLSPGLRLVITARRLSLLHAIEADIKLKFGSVVNILSVQLDVSNPIEVRNFVPSLPAEFRNIDVLINNAGFVKGIDQAPEIDEHDIDDMLSTNFTGLVNMTQAILKIYKTRPGGASGDIINIGSIAGRDPYAGGSIYCATKAAVRSFTDSLRRELVSTRIRVIEIDPGQVETEFSLVRFSGDAIRAKAVYEGCEPLTPNDVAEVIVFAVTRRQNVVMAETLLYPNHQASATVLHRSNN